MVEHPNSMRTYIVQSATANMPSSCWGRYGRVAVLEVDSMMRTSVSMISERARGVIRVVRTWEKLNIGKTERCAFERAIAAAEELAQELNEAARMKEAINA